MNGGQKGIFICFTGIDGGGKTTQAKILVSAMDRDGIRFRYVYNRLEPFLLKPFILAGRALFLRGKEQRGSYAEYSKAKRKLFKSSIVSGTYQLLLLADYSFQAFFKVKLPLILKRNIVCDRYIFDTVVTDLAANFNYSAERVRLIINRLLCILPRPELVFLLDLPEEIAYQRKSDTPSIEYLKERRRRYLDVGKKYGMTILDGDQSLEEIQRAIESEVKSRLGKHRNMEEAVLKLAKFDKSNLAENPTVKLLRIIGSPLDGTSGLPTVCNEELKTYEYAVKSKIGLLYLEAVRQRGTLIELKDTYDDECGKYNKFLDGIARVSQIFELAGIGYVVFKTIRPYPANPHDIDVLIMGDYGKHRRAVEALERIGYSIMNGEGGVANLEIEAALADPEGGTQIDLQREVKANYLIYMDKQQFTDYIRKASLPKVSQTNVLAPELDLAIVIAHSVMAEHLYTLGDYYTFLYRLSEFEDSDVDSFIELLRQNHILTAAKSFISVTALLSQVAFGAVPQKMGYVLDKIGLDTTEANIMIKEHFRVPHRYTLLTLARFLLEKTKEPRFRKSMGTQIVKMANPKKLKRVVSALVDRRRREAY